MEEMNRENARRITLSGGPNLEKVVNELLKYQARGESVVYDFNGHELYSCDVTMDSAFLEVTGRTKAEYDAEEAKILKEHKDLRDITYEEMIKNIVDNPRKMVGELVNGMALTESWISIEDIKTILPYLPEEQYQELVEGGRNDDFIISLTDNGEYVLKQIHYLRSKMVSTINFDELDPVKFAGVVEKAMQSHLDYGYFRPNDRVTASEMPGTLKTHIDIARECLSREEKSPLQKREEELSGLEDEANRIEAEAARKTGDEGRGEG